MRTVAVLVALVALTGACSTPEKRDTAGRSTTTADAEASRPSPMPEPRTEVAGVAWDGRIVVAGGLRADGSTSDRVDAYDPATNAWTPLPRLPEPRHHTALVVAGERLVVVAGYTPEGDAWRPLASVLSLGAGEASWRPEPSLGTPRGAPAAVGVDNGVVFVAGGVSPAGVESSMEGWKLGAPRWSSHPPMRERREHFGMAAIGDVLHAVAGRAGGPETNVSTVETINPFRDDSWSSAPPLQDARGGSAVAAEGDAICTAGGETATVTIASIECLRDGRWVHVGDLEVARHGLALVFLDGRLHAVGGGPRPGLHVSDAHEVHAVG